MKRFAECIWPGALVLFMFPWFAEETLAQEKPADRSSFEPQPLFEDRFQADSRAKFEVDGEVAWEPGRLTLAPESTIKRAKASGFHVAVDLELEFPQLAKDGSQSVSSLRFQLDGADDCYVQWKRTRKAGAVHAELSIYDTGKVLGFTRNILVKQRAAESDFAAGKWSVRYNYGLVKVAAPDGQLLVGYIDNGPAMLASMQLAASKQPLGVKHLSASATARPKPLTAEQSKELGEARKFQFQTDQLRRQGKPAEAVAASRKEAEIVGRLLGEHHPAYAHNLSNRAELHRSAGDYPAAESLLRKSSELALQAYGNDHPLYASNVSMLGSLLQSMGKYADAEPLLEQSGAIQRNTFGNDHLVVGIEANNLALLYNEMGDYAKAEPLFAQARDIFKAKMGPSSPYYATTLVNLAGVWMRTGKHAQAEPLLKQASELIKRIRGERHVDHINSLNMLAGLHQTTGEFQEAKQLFARVAELGKQALGEEHPAHAADLLNLASAHASTGEYAAAEPLYGKARDVLARTLGPEHPRYARCLSNMAALYRMKREPEQAEPLLEEALNVQQANTERVLTSESEAQSLNYLAAAPPVIDQLLSVALDLERSPQDAYQYVWRGRRMLHRATAERARQARLIARDGSAATRTKFREYEQARRRISQLVMAESAEKSEERKQELARLADQKEALERELARQLPGFASLLQSSRAKPEELVKQLSARDVFIDVVRYGRFEQLPGAPGKKGERRTSSYAAFVLHADGKVQRIELGPAEPIDKAARGWRGAISRGEPGRRSADALARLVWQPLVQTLPKDATTLYLCPDGSLATIPWAALPTGEGKRIVLEQYAVAVVPHGQFLLRQLSARPAVELGKDRILTVGGVRFDKQAADQKRAAFAGNSATKEKRLQWDLLPGTEQEVADVASQAGDRKVTRLDGTNAAAERVLSELAKHNYAHLATHGFFADASFRSYLQVREEHFEQDRPLEGVGSRSTFAGRNPLVLSGLVFAGANLPRRRDVLGIPIDDGGILTAEAIAGLPLDDLKLTVLSACETGLGDSAGGEGVYGLQRAFHIAGTDNVVASLWKVDDNATAALMKLFYHHLWTEGKPPLEALRSAQLTVYRRPDLIKEISSSRGKGVMLKLVDKARTPVPARTQSTAATRLWAAFVLSGAGR